MSKTFLISCVGCEQSDVPDLHEMMDESEDIEHDDFKEELAEDAYEQFFNELGYGDWLHLKDDYAVSFSRSTFKGEDCVYCTHSAIEYIFTRG